LLDGDVFKELGQSDQKRSNADDQHNVDGTPWSAPYLHKQLKVTITFTFKSKFEAGLLRGDTAVAHALNW